MTVSAPSNRHLPIALRSSLLLNTRAHKCWAEFSLQQILQCKEKVPMRSANMHRWPQIARKQLETDVSLSVVCRGIEEKRGGMTSKYSGWARAQAAEHLSTISLHTIANSFTQYKHQHSAYVHICKHNHKDKQLKMRPSCWLKAGRRRKVQYLRAVWHSIWKANSEWRRGWEVES